MRAMNASIDDAVDAAASLSERLQEVLLLIAEGYSNKAIARKLVLEERSVEVYISSINHKLGLEAEMINEYTPRIICVVAVNYARQLGVQPPVQRTHPELTERQEEIILLVGSGVSNAQIAKELRLKLKTVENYIRAIKNEISGDEDGLSNRVFWVYAADYARKYQQQQALALQKTA